jgi:hypothetical protein
MMKGGERMIFFIAPFVWMMAVPIVIIVVLLLRMLFWARALRGPQEARRRRPDQPFIEGEFVDEEMDSPEDGSTSPRGPLEK